MRILFMANFGMGLYRFRLELIEELLRENHEIYLSFPTDDYSARLEALGCKLIPVRLSRRGRNPIKDIALIADYIRMIRRVKPELVLTYTIKPNIYGGIACRITKTPYITTITGLGTALENRGRLERLAIRLYKAGIRGAECVFFQNKVNKQYFVEKGIPFKRSKIIPGSGVNLEQFAYEEYPPENGEVRFLYVGRIMKEKGIDELLKAAGMLLEVYPNVKFELAGFCEEEEQLNIRKYEDKEGIRFLGVQKEVIPLYHKAHAVILPSHHEGMSNVLLEAAAIGRPLLASDISGCREAFEEGVSGYGFRPKSTTDLVNTVRKFMELPYDQKAAMGLAGRRKMEKEFDRRNIVWEYRKEMNLVRVRKMGLIDDIVAKREKIAIIGLGYVGIPIAVAFAEIAGVIGFDINKDKIDLYLKGTDPTKEVGDTAITASGIEFTSEEGRLKEARLMIIAVPTPVKKDHTPDLTAIEMASRTAGRNLQPGAVVVYESTVYPGVTEEICIPILEVESGMKCGIDFSVGYSPERINPGDREHRLETITKVVSGYDPKTTELIAGLYSLIVRAGIYKAGSIKEAEAAKVIENSQRDINIAFMNELSIIFHKMGIDTQEVLRAASTKWNFLEFKPGLVGGHCIGVDPYYLTYQAEKLGYHSQVILSGRKTNDEMGIYVAEQLIKKIMQAEIGSGKKNIAILGFTFKENCPDTRNSRVYDIVKELREYGLEPVISDPQADIRQTEEEYGISLIPLSEVKDMDALILAVAHREFTDLTPEELGCFFRPGPNKKKILFDLKGILDKKTYEELGYCYWRL